MTEKNGNEKEKYLFSDSYEWTHLGENFKVIVRHWKRRDINCWNVYANIYEKHPLFDRILTESLSDEAATMLPLHWGPSYHEWYYRENGVCSFKKIGSDYMHLGDDRYERIDNKEDAYQVFNDAKELIDYLNNTIEKERT